MDENGEELHVHCPLETTDWISLIQNDISILYSMQFTFISVLTATLLVLPTVVYFKLPEVSIFNLTVIQTQMLFLAIYLLFIVFIIIFAQHIAKVIIGKQISRRSCFEILLGDIIRGETVDTNDIASRYLKIRTSLSKDDCDFRLEKE